MSNYHWHPGFDEEPVAVRVVDPQNRDKFVPPGMSPEQAKALDQGTDHSGVIQELLPGQKGIKLLNAMKRDAEGMIGLATVYVTVDDFKVIGNGEGDQKVVLSLFWGAGKGGNSNVIRIDATMGAIFSVPGTVSIDLRADLQTTDPTNGKSVTLTAAVAWGTSQIPKPCFMTNEGAAPIALPLGGALVLVGPFPIPQNAVAFTMLYDDPAQVANVTVEFFRDPALAPIYQITGITSTTAIPITGGAKFIKILHSAGAAMHVIPVFKLGL